MLARKKKVEKLVIGNGQNDTNVGGEGSKETLVFELRLWRFISKTVRSKSRKTKNPHKLYRVHYNPRILRKRQKA
jgi:hypothetical protein